MKKDYIANDLAVKSIVTPVGTEEEFLIFDQRGFSMLHYELRKLKGEKEDVQVLNVLKKTGFNKTSDKMRLQKWKHHQGGRTSFL